MVQKWSKISTRKWNRGNSNRLFENRFGKKIARLLLENLRKPKKFKKISNHLPFLNFASKFSKIIIMTHHAFNFAVRVFRVMSLRPFCTTIWSVKLRESRDFWHLYENIYRWLDVKSLKSLKVIKNSAGYHHWHVELIFHWFSSKAMRFIKPFWPIRSKRCSRKCREFNCISLEILRITFFHFFCRQQMFTEKIRLNQFKI